MVTAIYSVGKVTGAEIWVWGFFICIPVFLIICLLFKANRTKKGVIAILLGLFAAEILCDISWFLIYYSSGGYRNYGMRGVYGILLWPALLIVAGVFGTGRNIARSKIK